MHEQVVVSFTFSANKLFIWGPSRLDGPGTFDMERPLLVPLSSQIFRRSHDSRAHVELSSFLTRYPNTQHRGLAPSGGIRRVQRRQLSALLNGLQSSDALFAPETHCSALG